ncbi:CMP/dCMP-type deaminase domain-containing protein [Aphelenchoides fujianensis]|nr:CMP/dCMP-type deaminase domain-containing protein [Aphelenchoides fujianensis]
MSEEAGGRVLLEDADDRRHYEEAVRMAERGLEAMRSARRVRDRPRGRRSLREATTRSTNAFNSTFHAELVAIDQLYKWSSGERAGLPRNPPAMLAVRESGALLHWGRVVFGAPNERFGGMGSVMSNADFKHPHEIQIVRNVDVERSVRLLKRFYQQENPFAPPEKRKTRNKPPAFLCFCRLTASLRIQGFIAAIKQEERKMPTIVQPRKTVNTYKQSRSTTIAANFQLLLVASSRSSSCIRFVIV